MTKEIKGEPYSITDNAFGWGVVRLEKKIDRIGRSYQVFKARNGVPARCSCPDSTHRGSVCKHMLAILDLYMPSKPEEN